MLTIFVKSLRFSVYNIILFSNSDSLNFFLSHLNVLLCFSCPNTLAKISNIISSKSDENRYLCLVPDLSEKTFKFSILNMMLAAGLSYIAFIMLSYVPCIPSVLRSLHHERC